MAAEMPHVPHPLRSALAGLFADLSADERDEILVRLAWYRARQRPRRDADGDR